MLKPQKRKITKKNLKEDKFVDFALTAKSYIEDNSKQIAIIAVVVFALFILIMVYRNSQAAKTEEAKTILGKAQIEFQNMNYSKARMFLDRLIDEYSGTDAADQGYFVLANLDYQQGKYEQAEAEYKKFIDSYDGSKILLASGYAGYAACLEYRGAYEDAAKYYLRAQKTAPDFVEAANYLYLAGKDYLRAGLDNRAKEMFEIITKKYKKSKRFTDAKAQLIILAKK